VSLAGAINENTTQCDIQEADIKQGEKRRVESPKVEEHPKSAEFWVSREQSSRELRLANDVQGKMAMAKFVWEA
jgi:hypothetical protein